MTAPPGLAPTLDRDASRKKLAQSMGEVCPDVAALIAEMRAAGQYISPSRAQAMYDRLMASVDVERDEGGPALVVTRRGAGGRISRSVPADAAVGERVARRLS